MGRQGGRGRGGARWRVDRWRTTGSVLGVALCALALARGTPVMTMGETTSRGAARRALRSFGSGTGKTIAEHRVHLSTGVSKELVQRVAKDGAVIVTWANSHYYDFALNWLRHLDALGVENYLIGAMDEEMYAKLRKIGVPCWLMGSQGIDKEAVTRDFGWGSKNFHKMGRDKIRLIRDFTKTGTDVLISDIDVAWLRDPIPFFRRYPKADILVSTDNLRNITHESPEQIAKTVDGEGLEPPCAGTANIGMMWFRSTSGSQAITDEWVNNLEKDDKIWDQAEFNTLMHKGGCGMDNDGSGVGKAYNGKIMLGTLPVALFNNGHTYFTQRLPEAINVNPYAMHATFQYEGTPGKRNRMREANQWLGDRDDASYFEQKFLSYTPRVLKGVDVTQFEKLGYPTMDHQLKTLEEGDPVILEHMRLVQHQIAQLYEAVAVAKSLNRVLIAPPFFCGLDRAWFPHGGRFPGSMLTLPFICPLDHVMAIESYGSSFVEEYREYSFLGHPDMPKDTVTKENVRRVEVEPTVSFSKTAPIDPKYGMCFQKRDNEGKIIDNNDDECVPARNNVFQSAKAIKLSGQVDSLEDLAAALDSVVNVKFLHFDTIIGVTKSSQASTTTQIRMGIWCCRMGNHEFYKVDKVDLFEIRAPEGIFPDESEMANASTTLALPASRSNSTIIEGNERNEPTPEDDAERHEVENDDAKDKMKKTDEERKETGEQTDDQTDDQTSSSPDAAAIEAGLTKFFKGDLKKVGAALHLIEEAHEAGLDKTD